MVSQRCGYNLRSFYVESATSLKISGVMNYSISLLKNSDALYLPRQRPEELPILIHTHSFPFPSTWQAPPCAVISPLGLLLRISATNHDPVPAISGQSISPSLQIQPYFGYYHCSSMLFHQEDCCHCCLSEMIVVILPESIFVLP